MRERNKQPTFGVVATAISKEQEAWGGFPQVIENWRQMARATVLVIPKDMEPPRIAKVRIVQSKHAQPLLAEVLQAAVDASASVPGEIVICDPMVVMRFSIFEVQKLAAKRQLGSSWVATGLCRVIVDYLQGVGERENDGLRWFVSNANVWRYAITKIHANAPFLQNIWGGLLAAYAVKHVHHHRYHDITSLDAIAVMAGAPVNEGTEADFQYWTKTAHFSPPTKSYIASDYRR